MGGVTFYYLKTNYLKAFQNLIVIKLTRPAWAGFKTEEEGKAKILEINASSPGLVVRQKTHDREVLGSNPR